MVKALVKISVKVSIRFHCVAFEDKLHCSRRGGGGGGRRNYSGVSEYWSCYGEFQARALRFLVIKVSIKVCIRLHCVSLEEELFRS